MSFDVGGGQAGSSVGGGIGSLIGGPLVLAGLGGPSGQADRQKAVDAWEKLKLVNFDMREIPPEQIKVFAEIFPELYQAVLPLQPTQVQDSTEMRNVQLQSLAKLQQMAQEGLPTAERIAAQEAQRSVGAQAQRNQESVLQDLAQRGRLSAGDEIAARIAGNQGATNLAAQQGNDLAQMGTQNRLAGIQGAANLGGSIRSADINLRSQNADIINRFNEIVSALGTQQAQENAAAKGQANLYNAQTAQHVGETNALAQTQAAQRNQEYQNTLRQQGYQNELDKLKGYTQQLDLLAAGQDLEKQNKDKAIMATAQGGGSLLGGGLGGLL